MVNEMNSVLTSKPGITGWAQVNGRDNLELKDKIFLDEQYLKNQSLILDINFGRKHINIINSKILYIDFFELELILFSYL